MSETLARQIRDERRAVLERIDREMAPQQRRIIERARGRDRLSRIDEQPAGVGSLGGAFALRNASASRFVTLL